MTRRPPSSPSPSTARGTPTSALRSMRRRILQPAPRSRRQAPSNPTPCQWNFYVAQSLNLTKGTGGATWTVTPITTTPMHVGDICNLGIFCVAPSSNRNLLDFIMEAIDNHGCAHIAYADDNTVNKLRVANQTAGTCL